MRKRLANCLGNTKNLEKRREEKVKGYKNYITKLEKHTEENLAHIFVKALQRPFLFQEAGETRKVPKNIEKPTKVKIHDRKPNEEP